MIFLLRANKIMTTTTMTIVIPHGSERITLQRRRPYDQMCRRIL